ncbi:right-handed parallel beta-helix repeat-containing protein [Granulicella sp. dw_53]|uniref:right-handed parallel beta-helix repeat-containing protein n=1 Tax=Granulicella sp. dw_53 TaxID=2719792 RepID=UPI001BD2CFB7|nr:right-handed parallel beta-helix repeat-containing protein [Granulicella sp. dw_53]
MKQPRLALCVIAISLLATTGAQAQATRTWVSGVGDDANPCSRTAPCKTFAGAISKTATGGEIDALDPGAFGTVTITKAVTIDGGGQLSGIIASNTNAIIITAPATDVVTLRNLAIQGVGTGLDGIRMTSGKTLHIEHCTIANFTLNGINIIAGANAQVFINDTISQDNTGNGLNIMGTGGIVRANIANSHFSNNGNGIFSGDFSRTAVRDSDANGNASAGFTVVGNGGSATMSITNSTAANNLGTGIQSGGGGSVSSIRATNVSLFSNTVGFAIGTNGTISSFGNNANPGSGIPNATIPLQ